ncbi:MAG TPA: ABC transporter substrate-binding protein, partial [Clostridia bacterium]|nr:ABC transporter substrate-binding protein [Clostridia bacterium]
SCKKAQTAINIGIGGEPVTIDPQKAEDPASMQLAVLIYEGLTRFTNEGILPAAAISYDISEDGLTYTFTLRKDLKWSDGTPITPNDFKTGLLRAVTPSVKCPDARMYYGIKNAREYNEQVTDANNNPIKIKFVDGEFVLNESGEYIPDEFGVYRHQKPNGMPYVIDDVGITATDDKLIIELVRPMPELLYLLSRPSAMPYRSDISLQNASSPASGAWKIAKWEKNTSIVLERNKYYRDKPKIDSINCIPVTHEAAVGLIRSGNLDASILPRGRSAVIDMETVDTGRMTDGTMFYLQIFPEGSFADAKLRRAISSCIDREILSATIAGYPATGVIPDSVFDRSERLRDKLPTNSIFMGDPSYVEALDTPIQDIELRIAVNADSPEEADMAAEIQQYLYETLGVNIVIYSITFEEFPSHIQQKKCDAIFGSIGPFVSPSDYIRAIDPSYVNNTFENAENFIIHDSLYIPLSFGTFDFAHETKLNGLIFRNDGIIDLIQAYFD